jgi:hypothetical protein
VKELVVEIFERRALLTRILMPPSEMRTGCRSGSRRIGVSRESFRPGRLLPMRPAAGGLFTNLKICEKSRLSYGREGLRAVPFFARFEEYKWDGTEAVPPMNDRARPVPYISRIFAGSCER